MGTPAKTLTPGHVRRLQSHVRKQRYGTRNLTMVLLSFKAGLRAGEIAGLDWAMVLGAAGTIGQSIVISDRIAKYGRGRSVPLNSELKRALRCFHQECGRPLTGPVIASQRGHHMRPRSVVNWFSHVYAQLGLDGCSSHSGRRTFITRSARLVARAGGSLRDVQELAGHRAITTTERYIEGDRDAQRKLVRML